MVLDEEDTFCGTVVSRMPIQLDLPVNATSLANFLAETRLQHDVDGPDVVNDSPPSTNSSQQILGKRQITGLDPYLPLIAIDGPDSFSKIQYWQILRSVIDGLALAMAGYRGVDAYPDVLNRYFKPEDKCTLRDIFRRFVNQYADASPIFRRYTIYYDRSGDPGSDDVCMGAGEYAFSRPPNQPTPSDPTAKRGWCVVCPAFWTSPKVNHENMLAEVPCDSLGPNSQVSRATMRVGGSVLLHEWLHWDAIFDFWNGPIVDWDRNGDPNVIPDNGYGPYNAMLVNRYNHGRLNNAENFVWFALESYFQQACREKRFEDPTPS